LMSSCAVVGPAFLCFFCTDPAPTEIYTLSLHDALPISRPGLPLEPIGPPKWRPAHIHSGPASYWSSSSRRTSQAVTLKNGFGLVRAQELGPGLQGRACRTVLEHGQAQINRVVTLGWHGQDGAQLVLVGQRFSAVDDTGVHLA